ncbi:MAG: hypothetical protein M3022_13730 [Actinomycetota bacterium]|nr:hypothetical protein [Actinomycetota bacterium]
MLTVADPGTPLAMNLGSPADVTVRPSGDPAGVGLTQTFANLPNTFSVGGVNIPVSVTKLSSTFTGLRLPATCPTPAASVAVRVDSYADPSTRSASAPLNVTGCAALPFAPQFSVTATRDIADSGVQVVTDIRQKANEAPSRTVSLTLPPTVLAPNAAAVISNGLLCTDPSFAGCKVRHRELHLAAVPQTARRAGLPHRIADRTRDHDPLSGAVRAHAGRSSDTGDRHHDLHQPARHPAHRSQGDACGRLRRCLRRDVQPGRRYRDECAHDPERRS